MPLVEFVGIGEAGLDLCQCVSIGAELHSVTKPNFVTQQPQGQTPNLAKGDKPFYVTCHDT